MIHMRIGQPGSRGGQCQWRKLQKRWMLLLCSVNVCREVKRRNETSTRPRYGSNEWTQDRDRGWGHTRRASVSVWDGIGRCRSRAQVLLILRCQTQILAHLFLGYLVCNECNFWPKLGAVAQSVFPAPSFFSRDSRLHDGP